MLIKFTKMHGLGNDFMVIDAISQHVHIRPEKVKKLSDRNFGIGFDQMLIVEPPGRPDADFRYRIFNADGSEVQNCGNGARCFARFVSENRLTAKQIIRVETANGLLELMLTEKGGVRVNMGAPVLMPENVPFIPQGAVSAPKGYLVEYPIRVQDEGTSEDVKLGVLSMGNPHAVLLVDSVKKAPVSRLGPLLERHVCFPEKANIGFMEVVHRKFIRLRVFERGTGETLACGTGACAAVVSGRLRGLLDEEVEVKLPGGNLKIQWRGEGYPVMMEGPAVRVFDGQVRI